VGTVGWQEGMDDGSVTLVGGMIGRIAVNARGG
jgi:hypothetical protein